MCRGHPSPHVRAVAPVSQGAPDGRVASTSFRRRVRSGDAVLGTFIKLPVLEAIDLVADSDLDFAVVDLEHSQLGDAAGSALVRHGSALGLPVVVRLPTVEASLINRLLEAGAAGIQTSSLRLASSVTDLVAATRYAPGGHRSLSTAQPSAGYGSRSLREYLDGEANDPPLLIGQIETATTDDPLAEIIRGGLDVVFLGTTDLSADLGAPGALDDPRVVERMKEVARAAADSRTSLGGFAANSASYAALGALGSTYTVISSDVQALKEGLGALARAGNDLPARSAGGSQATGARRRDR